MVYFSDIDKAKDKPPEELPKEKAPALDAGVVYNEAAAFVKEIFQRRSEKKELDIEEVCRFIGKAVGPIASADDKIIFLTTGTYLKEYLCYHTVNVTILAIKVGLNLKYSSEQLVNLGALALLHALTGAEDEGYGAQELQRQEFIQKFIQARQLKEGFVKESLSIIAIVDVYESLTHMRSYRQRFMPHEVLKAIILASEKVFNPGIVKKIIEIFSIYPLGSFVRLNTEEVAQVVRINKDFPLRPQVDILIDSRGKRLKEKKAVDLSSHLNLYIKEPLLESPP